MTRRERLLATSLLAVLLVIAGGVLFHLFVFEPVNEVRLQLDAEQADLVAKQNQLTQEQQRIDHILRVNPRLTQWAQLSLPPRNPELKKAKLPVEEQKRKHHANLRVAYEAYLFNLMEAAGFRRGTIKVEVRQSTRPAAPSTRGKEKEPPFEQLTFGVVGDGTMQSVAGMMRDFYKTPLLHHVRSMNLGLANERNDKNAVPGLLKLDLTIDALIMASGEERARLEPAKLAYPPRVLADPARDYLVLNKVNMFTGLKPAARSTDAGPSPALSAQEKAEVLRFVKLTGILFDDDRKRWEGTLYDQAKGGREKVINAGSRDEFTILDKEDRTVFEGKVIRVEEDQVILQSEGKYFRLRCGEFLHPAVRKALSKRELGELGITPDASEGDRVKKENGRK